MPAVTNESDIMPTGREADHVRRIPRAAVKLWTGADEEDLSNEAFGLLTEMEDLAIVPLLEGPLRDDVESVTAVMALVTEQELRLRSRVLERLDLWLDDKRVLPERCIVMPVVEKQLPRRVCDEAYIALLRLTNGNGDEYELEVKARRFLSLSLKERNRIIDDEKRFKRVV